MSNMPQKGIIAGLLLIALGLIGYFAGGRASVTALIPAFMGIPILVSSFIAKNPEKLKMGMHIAAVFGLLGVIAPLGRIIPTALKGEFQFDRPGIFLILMFVICLWFMVECIKSFKAARRAKG